MLFYMAKEMCGCILGYRPKEGEIILDSPGTQPNHLSALKIEGEEESALEVRQKGRQREHDNRRL